MRAEMRAEILRDYARLRAQRRELLGGEKGREKKEREGEEAERIAGKS